MKLELHSGEAIDHPSPATLVDALRWSEAKVDTAVSLSRADESFIQAEFLDAGKIRAGYCDFPSNQSGISRDQMFPAEQLAEVFTLFAEGDPAWKLAVSWYPVRLVEKMTPNPALSGTAGGTPDELVVRQNYRSVRWTIWLTAGLAVNAGASWVWGVLRSGVDRYMHLTIAACLTALAVGFHRISFRCPRCDGRLRIRRAGECPHCGVRLR